jgi:hypothetical protein
MQKPMEFFGIPVYIDESIPDGEIWLYQKGEQRWIHVHEGPHAGEDLEVWVKKCHFVRLVGVDPAAIPRFKPVRGRSSTE